MFIAVERCHDHINSYKEKHLIGAVLQFQRFSPLSTWQHASRPGAGEEAETSTSGSASSRKRETLGLAWTFETLKPTTIDTLSAQKSKGLKVHILILELIAWLTKSICFYLY